MMQRTPKAMDRAVKTFSSASYGGLTQVRAPLANE